MPDITTPRTSRTLSGPPDLDRILLGVCAAVWLAALGVSVAAVVRLVDLGSGRGTVRAELAEASGSQTPWVLYTVIGVSAVVIAVAIPLLVRARKQSSERPVRSFTPAGGSVSEDIAAITPRPGRRRAAETPVVGSETAVRAGALPAVVEQVYLRCTAGVLAAVGAGTLAVAVATYLLAGDNETGAIALFIIAGLVTLAMPVLPWFFLRELRAVLGLGTPAA
ncbi:DUF2561 family protein [Mycolicibacterium neoaurum]|uniref:DUF2561 family protein n=1 Tax=Mycolicibacterium neoaurum TaxID=1795 RepID=UPI00248B9E86|nr:DUF2561 family protein [Mycolicibacterium neoaurum]WBP93817.1 DUF2561 family protein [Mycolicibacterium neoaurum]WBS07609.1 DUF2561 family protein [Mycolicibacterium neoaurum]